jgi:hypothetical protein
MTVTVKNKTPLVIPHAIRRRAGSWVTKWNYGLAVVSSPSLPKFPPPMTSTPEQRRMIDAQLDEAQEGPFHGPFDTADEMIIHIKGELKKSALAKKLKRDRGFSSGGRLTGVS